MDSFSISPFKLSSCQLSINWKCFIIIRSLFINLLWIPPMADIFSSRSLSQSVSLLVVILSADSNRSKSSITCTWSMSALLDATISAIVIRRQYLNRLIASSGLYDRARSVTGLSVFSLILPARILPPVVWPAIIRQTSLSSSWLNPKKLRISRFFNTLVLYPSILSGLSRVSIFSSLFILPISLIT